MQADFTISDGTGQQVLDDMNLQIQALASNNSGAGAPPTLYAGLHWYDTANKVEWRRNSTNDGWELIPTATGITGALLLPAGTTAQRPTLTSSQLAMRFNTDIGSFEGWNGTLWGSIGGGQMLGTAQNKAISYNAQTIAENITIPTGYNAMSVGAVKVNSGYTVTVSSGAVWKII